ncbi:hypothetical protein V9K92_08225 [Phyllobacterium sp. CCNWLW109]|uniref:hypothetical protein n=1 Tax=Phyllobacterium sp. CCNWLW109 TaxID=3127479 RepID=UPI003077A00D
MENYSWPSPRTLPDYPVKTKPLPRELIHAVGVVVIAWNEIEETHLDILRGLMGFNVGSYKFRMGSRILEPMGNRQRGDLLRGLVSEMEIPKATSAMLLAFQSHYDICLGNRNLIAHSQYIEEEHGILISSFKATPHISARYIPDDAEFWELTISDMRRLSDFGAGIVDFAFPLHSPEPLPDIPPPPRDLLRFLEVHKIERLQPQSSKE